MPPPCLVNVRRLKPVARGRVPCVGYLSPVAWGYHLPWVRYMLALALGSSWAPFVVPSVVNVTGDKGDRRIQPMMNTGRHYDAKP